VKRAVRSLPALALSLMVMLGTSMSVSADEEDAKRLLKAMSDYMAAQQAISFQHDATLEVVTKEDQKLALGSSGTLVLKRPDKIRATRSAGFADVEMSFDGKTLTLLGKNLNIYAQKNVPGTVDHLVDELVLSDLRPIVSGPGGGDFFLWCKTMSYILAKAGRRTAPWPELKPSRSASTGMTLSPALSRADAIPRSARYCAILCACWKNRRPLPGWRPCGRR
jgi:hypothetical protein